MLGALRLLKCWKKREQHCLQNEDVLVVSSVWRYLQTRLSGQFCHRLLLKLQPGDQFFCRPIPVLDKVRQDVSFGFDYRKIPFCVIRSMGWKLHDGFGVKGL